ncbi:hypothetical protein FBY31_1249 [Arthrobacter sp. SLBN-100]|uniref:DUF6541 family protein n=1 Tax=Arthrobacter sp. SLBN-100 TaxID=2768450 RepID=UPI001153E8ED|nr:DUF6541 family protein [Arthrobacter sp. SLBN-100]TQJ67188.1 hypothetical protein FBY31_1249 [Arthrobacter sp. SLBN-100]
MSWWNALPAFAVAFLITFGPGGALAYFIGARRLTLLCLAPLLSVGIIGVAGIAAGAVGLGWGLTPLLLTTGGACTAAWALRRFVFKAGFPVTQPAPFLAWAGAATGIAVGGILIARRLKQVIGSPENFAQRFDNVFHLNAIRYIIETGNASSLTLGGMAGGEGGGAIYPSAWHSIAALVAQLSATDVVVAENVFNITIGAVVWPATLILLVHRIVGPRPVGLALTGVFAAGFTAFPISIMDFGPLYPNILSYALLPAALAMVIGVCRVGFDHTEDRIMLWMALIVAVPALALSQTNGLLSLAAFSLPLGLWVAGRALLVQRGQPIRYRLIILGATLVGLLVFALVWRVLRPLVDYDGWAPFTSLTGAVGEVILNAPIGRPVAWALSVLSLIGLRQVLRKTQDFWIVLCWLVPVILYITTASSPKGFWRMLLTGGWYQDSYRLAALLPIFTVVLATVGSLFLWDLIKTPVAKVAAQWRAPLSYRFRAAPAAGLAALFILAAVVATQTGTMRGITEEASRAYVLDSSSPIVDSDELAVIKRLGENVPGDATIAVNPWNGGSLAYALTGRKVSTYHMFSANDPELAVINEELGEALPGSTVCSIAKARHVDFILDFGSTYLANAEGAQEFRGVVDVKPSPSVQVADSQGDAKLLKVVSCG